MSEFKKQVEVIGVIVLGQEPGVSANKTTGQIAIDPKTKHIMPGEILLIDDRKTYEKWKRMRVIRDYDPDTGSRTRSLESIFGPTDTGAFAAADAAAVQELEDLKARQAEKEAQHARDLEAAKQQAREDARREILAEMAQAKAQAKAQEEAEAAQRAKQEEAEGEGAPKAGPAPKAKAKGKAADSDDLV